MKHDDMHGPTRREREILDLRETGMHQHDIARQLNVGEEYTRRVCSNLSGSWSNSEVFEKMIRTGSQALAQRLQQVFGEAA